MRRFTLVDESGKFPKVDKGLKSNRLLTNRLDETYVYDDYDNPSLKASYYNALYKGIAVFTPFFVEDDLDNT